MAKIERFEDLIAWQKARELRKHGYAGDRRIGISSRVGLPQPDSSRRTFGHVQYRRRFRAREPRRFRPLLVMSKASCGEVRSLLYTALNDELIDHVTFERIYAQTEEVGRIVGGLRVAVATQKASTKG